jgi:LysR family transcriptional regulator (chromosome initiation inhibitor)
MDVSVDQLRTLAAVVDEGTFDAASVALGITPSAVSQRIKALEVACGRVLVTRGKPVRATPPGQVVLRLARVTAQLADDTARELGVGGPAGLARLPLAVNADSHRHVVPPGAGARAGATARRLRCAHRRPGPDVRVVHDPSPCSRP